VSSTPARSTHITRARLFTGVDGEVIDDGTVVVDAGTIVHAGPTVDAPLAGDATVVDVAGRFVMPGMTDSHVHLAYATAAPTRLNSSPVQIAMLDAVDNARVLLGSGFTSAISFGAAQGTDVPLRDAIDAGRVPGPRLLANDRDVGSTGSNADSSSPGSEGLKLIVDGPWAVRAAVRELAKKRCDVVKLFLDGESLNAYAPPGMLTYTDEEVAACIDEALRCKEEGVSRAILFNLCGHGNFDMQAYRDYLDGKLMDLEYDDGEIAMALSGLPSVA
jgi:imidazolonepropionase-like amidohydrolase